MSTDRRDVRPSAAPDRGHPQPSTRHAPPEAPYPRPAAGCPARSIPLSKSPIALPSLELPRLSGCLTTNPRVSSMTFVACPDGLPQHAKTHGLVMFML